MARPVVITVDDDPEVLRAIDRDLRQRYADRYRVIRSDSGAAALAALRQLVARDEPVALLLVDQRMPQMSGVDLLEEARTLYPDARRVLLTAYADTTAAIRAINHVKLDHYLLKPWDPPEEQLYPVLDGLLEDWQAGYRPPFEGIRVIGNRWSPRSHEMRNFLARNQVPFQWIDVESAEGRRLAPDARARDLDGQVLPVVLFPDGSRLDAPATGVIAEKIGLRTRAQRPFYDLAVVGAGPAGLAAAVYGASEGLTVAIVEREAPGGQAGESSRIENYLGFPSGLSGGDLARRAVAQATRFGAEILTPQEACALRLEGPYRMVALGDGTEIACHALLIATGVSYRQLDVPGVAALTGAGIYYGAATTEALSCRDEDVYIVGGANSAGQAAVYFARYARTVTILARSPLAKSMSQYLIDQIGQTPNIVVREQAQVVAAEGADHLDRITIADTETGERQTVPAASLFIFIGAMPRTDWLGDAVDRDRQGFILAGPDLPRDSQGRPRGWPLDRDPFLLETRVPGVFVAGDVRAGSVKRVASGVGEGSIAISFVHQYLSQFRGAT